MVSWFAFYFLSCLSTISTLVSCWESADDSANLGARWSTNRLKVDPLSMQLCSDSKYYDVATSSAWQNQWEDEGQFKTVSEMGPFQPLQNHRSLTILSLVKLNIRHDHSLSILPMLLFGAAWTCTQFPRLWIWLSKLGLLLEMMIIWSVWRSKSNLTQE